MYVTEKLIHDCILLYCKDMIFIYWISNITCVISIQTFIPFNVSLADKSQYSKIKKSKFNKIKKIYQIQNKVFRSMNIHRIKANCSLNFFVKKQNFYYVFFKLHFENIRIQPKIFKPEIPPRIFFHVKTKCFKIWL